MYKKLLRVPSYRKFLSPCCRHIVQNCIQEYILLRLRSRGSMCFFLHSVFIKKSNKFTSMVNK